MKWADILVIAPLSANSLAKISAGLCDNLVVCVFKNLTHVEWFLLFYCCCYYFNA
jgi:phosphopantothenoylcysteine synthetase/decarboxylase